jgi:hypothetical protein
MARTTLARSTLRILPALTVIALAVPAAAQFGTIFGPPRPPADIPQDTRYPADPRAAPQPRYDPRYEPRPEPPPPPLTRLPPQQQQRPGGPPPGVQTQPLPPPPGATAATPPAQQPGAAPGTLPGLAPGQRQPRGTPQGPTSDEVVVAPPKQKIVNGTAVFAGLDKITGRIISFDVAMDETVQFGALRLTPRACYTRPPTETPNTDGFFEVDEITLQGEVKRIFTGWMFAASPGLHGVEHPIYDVWLTDCKEPAQVAAAQEPTPEPPAATAPPPRQQRQPQPPRQRAAPPQTQNAPAPPAQNPPPLRR